jgi:hypothetical protein
MDEVLLLIILRIPLLAGNFKKLASIFYNYQKIVNILSISSFFVPLHAISAFWSSHSLSLLILENAGFKSHN